MKKTRIKVICFVIVILIATIMGITLLGYIKLKNKIKVLTSNTVQLENKITTLEEEINNNILLKKASQFDYSWIDFTSGYIAHGLGEVEGCFITNSWEAFELSYANNFRVFEADIHLTQEGNAVLYHDIDAWHKMTDERLTLNYSDFKSHALYNKYHAMDVKDLCFLMQLYPDVYVIIDYGAPAYDYENTIWYSNLAYWGRQYSVIDRIIIEIIDEKTLEDAFRIFDWKSVVFTYYNEIWKDEDDAIMFCRNNNIRAMNMTYHQYEVYGADKWLDNQIAVLVFTVNDKEIRDKLLSNNISAIYSDSLAPQ